MTTAKGTVFVVMGFGKRTDFETGRTLDLDKTYHGLVKPAVEAAGLRCLRADEIVHSGLIDVPMYEQLLEAEIVVVDLSTSNRNALYELGIRHALRPYSTIIIAEEQWRSSFDVHHVRIHTYKHFGEDIGFQEAARFRTLLTEAIRAVMTAPEKERIDSPVYTFVSGLVPPHRQPVSGATALQAEAAPAASGTPDASYAKLMGAIDRAIERGEFTTARALLRNVEGRTAAKSDDVQWVQRLALATYKSRQPTEFAALKEAEKLLAELSPETSNDTQTLGLWARIHERSWQLTGEAWHLDEAMYAFKRGFCLRNDHENGIELAFLHNARAARAVQLPDAVADFVTARRLRGEVLAICERWLAKIPAPKAGAGVEAREQDAKARYSVLAAIAEAKTGLEHPDAAASVEAAYALAPDRAAADATRQRIALLEPLLEKSPLKRLNAV